MRRCWTRRVPQGHWGRSVTVWLSPGPTVAEGSEVFETHPCSAEKGQRAHRRAQSSRTAQLVCRQSGALAEVEIRAAPSAGLQAARTGQEATGYSRSVRLSHPVHGSNPVR